MALFCLQWENNSVDNLFRTITYLRSVIVRELQQSLCHHGSSWMLLHIHTHLMWHSWHSIVIWIAAKKYTLGHTSELKASCKSFHNLKHRIEGGFLIKFIKKFVLRIINILFLLLWLNFSFFPLHCFHPGELLLLCCTKTLTLGEKPTLNATVPAELPRTEYYSGRHDCFAYIPWVWASQVREGARLTQIRDLRT